MASLLARFAAVATAGAVASAASADELEDAIALIERLESESASVDFDDLPIARVIDELGARTPVPVRADWTALERIGVSPRDDVRVRLDEAPLWTILGGIAIQLGDEFERARFETWAGQIVLTSAQGSAAMQATAVYDVRDLVAAGAAERMRADTDADADADADTDADTDADATPGLGEMTAPPLDEMLARVRAARPLTPGEELMALVTDHVEPESWSRAGGSRASISERSGVFIVTAPPTTHLRLRRALDRLRAAFFTTVTMDAAIVDVPQATFDRLARRYGLSTVAFAHTVLAAEDAVVRWRSVSSAAVDRTLVIESGGAGTSVTLRLVPSFDRERGTMTVSVAAEMIAGDDRRRVETEVTIAVRTGAVTIQLAPAAPAETVRMLVVIPQPG
jgi:hypothetical protein